MKNVENLDGFQYVGGELNFFPHGEGYVNVTLGTTGNRIFNYVYYYTDHLGNIRLTYTKDMVSNQLKIMDENHYYPFGLKHSVYAGGIKDYKEDPAGPGGTILTNVTQTAYQYKYNGKELQDELGLGLYDYGARLYDPALGRWNVIDPLAEKFVPLSPYSYVANNPIIFIDKQGKIIGNPDGTDAKRLQAILSKTETGRQVWNSMVKSDRNIYVHYVSAAGDDTAKATNTYLKNQSADGMLVSGDMYDSIVNESAYSSEVWDKAWSFNEETGEYDKTSDWDESHLLINEEGLTLESAILGAIFDNEDIGKDVAEIRIAGEEAYHSIQDSADFKGKEDDASYHDRKHEIEAKAAAKQMEKEYLEQ